MVGLYNDIEPTKKYNGSTFLMAILMIITMSPWFYFFYQPEATTAFLINVIIASVAFILSSGSFKFIGSSVVFLVFITAALFGTAGNANAYIGTVLKAVPFLFFLCADDHYKCATIKVFNNIFSWIIVVSLFFWLLYLLGLPLPHTLLKERDMYTFENYYFFLRNIHNLDKVFFPRFCSIFLEPGYISCIMALLIFLGNYDFKKWQNIIYLIALFFTFSLAGWLFFFILFIPFLRNKGSLRWYYLGGLSILIMTFVYLNYYSQGDNVVKKMVGARIEVEDGEMVGYNRSNDDLNYYWANKLVPEGKLLMGLREDYTEKYNFEGAVELRAYVVRFGLIATILYLFFMYACYRKNKSQFGLWYAIVAFLFVFRGYHVMFTSFFLFVYSGGLAILKINEACQNDLSLNVIDQFE